MTFSDFLNDNTQLNEGSKFMSVLSPAAKKNLRKLAALAGTRIDLNKLQDYTKVKLSQFTPATVSSTNHFIAVEGDDVAIFMFAASDYKGDFGGRRIYASGKLEKAIGSFYVSPKNYSKSAKVFKDYAKENDVTIYQLQSFSLENNVELGRRERDKENEETRDVLKTDISSRLSDYKLFKPAKEGLKKLANDLQSKLEDIKRDIDRALHDEDAAEIINKFKEIAKQVNKFNS